MSPVSGQARGGKGRLTVLPALLLLLLLAGCAEFEYGSQLPRRGSAGPPPTVYEVRRGDTLYSIAWRHGLDFRRVAAWNGIGAPYRIYPGDRLRLRPPPGGGPRETASGSSSRRPESAPGSQRQPESRPETSSRAASSPAPAGTGEVSWRWPLEGRIVRGYDANNAGKRGISIAGEPGATVRAAAPGRVVYSGSGLRGYGNLVIVKHNARYLTAYGYNRELLVGEGDDVGAGDPIARLGSGPNRDGELHFEIRRDGEPVNPERYLPRR
ncbi:peptidoglycan DD-metalloendopeptidase family protein [Spiribacter halobius]|uniref:Peptidase M23 n=1 Tax=Sediminicurvatus halobius TaxID=2182432 RepID=A0A2U2N4B3_9GAMM|nr:peptidoglycan DD-metalloendopeptidase family protein [Spiribacter halobius]PWG63932.1 peptidase M23 [Spiribacter halobius]UEX76346.1 peptidoglycan DD-metalloendopeptidase family protein [Spiribacter halobius]